MKQKNSNPKTFAKKLSVETIIAIANILLTIITGIVITIYLQNKSLAFQEQLQARDQEFQRQLIELQNAEELKSSRAYIQSASLCQSGQRCQGSGGIEIVNNGTAIAENLRIALYIDRVNYYWGEQITSIDKFDFTTTNASLPYDTEITNTAYRPNVGYPMQLEGNNTLIITIEKLPPGERIGFIFSLGDNLSMTQKTVITQATITVPDNVDSDWQKSLLTHLQDHMSKYGNTALLVYEMSCDNCDYSRKSDTFAIPSYIRLDHMEFTEEIKTNDLNQEIAQVQIASLYWATETSEDSLPIDPISLMLEAKEDGNYWVIRLANN